MLRLDNLSLNQAVIKGKMEQKVETAKKLLNQGQNTTNIATVTGLCETAVKKLDSKSVNTAGTIDNSSINSTNNSATASTVRPDDTNHLIF